MADEFDDVEIPAGAKVIPAGPDLGDFYSYMRQHEYIFVPARELWPASSINGRFGKVQVGTAANGKPILIPSSTWLDQHRPVDQMTWAPGMPMMIDDKVIREGGWIEQPGARVFNLYQPPTQTLGDSAQADPWLEHVGLIFPEHAEHIIRYLAHRVQRPGEKINHALLLGSEGQGIGKDGLLAPVRQALGSWNWSEQNPQTVLKSPYNGYLRAVVLRISEVKDLGDGDRYKFYEHMKAATTSPPEVLSVNEKYIREYPIANVVAVIYTTNHKQDGMYLMAEDRRTYVAWSKMKKEDFPEDYWNKLWGWYDNGGYGHVAAFLASIDLSGFDPKAPPPRTEVFWEIVGGHQPPQSAELADALDKIAAALDGNNGKPPEEHERPAAVTIKMVMRYASERLEEWLKDHRHHRIIPHRFEDCGYVPVRNPDRAANSSGLWIVGKQRQMIYALASLDPDAQIAAAQQLKKEEDEFYEKNKRYEDCD
jgi:hypothetical protein